MTKADHIFKKLATQEKSAGLATKAWNLAANTLKPKKSILLRKTPRWAMNTDDALAKASLAVTNAATHPAVNATLPFLDDAVKLF